MSIIEVFAPLRQLDFNKVFVIVDLDSFYFLLYHYSYFLYFGVVNNHEAHHVLVDEVSTW